VAALQAERTLEPGEVVPVIVQSVRDNRVLMLAWMNDEALRRTRETGEMHYWSRSRNALWRKGETSGNTQRLVSLQWDCDRDTLLARVAERGPACHLGDATCFGNEEFAPRSVLEELEGVFEERRKTPPPDSYVASLQADRLRMLKKVGEEASEVIVAASSDSPAALTAEAADLLFHLLLVLHDRGVTFRKVLEELERRRPPRPAEG